MKPARRCEIAIDGASRGNPGPAGIGIVFQDGKAGPTREFFKYLGETTNNVAEYLALVYALQDALREGYTELTVRTDSELLVRQINGQYRVRDSRLRLFHDLAFHLLRGFRRWEIRHVPRTENRLADRLANQAVSRAL